MVDKNEHRLSASNRGPPPAHARQKTGSEETERAREGRGTKAANAFDVFTFRTVRS